MTSRYCAYLILAMRFSELKYLTLNAQQGLQIVSLYLSTMVVSCNHYILPQHLLQTGYACSMQEQNADNFETNLGIIPNRSWGSLVTAFFCAGSHAALNHYGIILDCRLDQELEMSRYFFIIRHDICR